MRLMNNLVLWNGNSYAQNSSSQQSRAHRALAQANLVKKIDVLDVGCGTGEITSIIAKTVYPGKVIGIDKDSSMLAKASMHLNHYINLDFVLENVLDFQFKQKFDLITSFFCLQWLPKKSLILALKNIQAHLKDQGKICIMLPCFDFPHEIVKRVAFSNKWKSHFQSFHEPQTFLEQSEYEEIIRDLNFVNSNVITVKSEHLLTDQQFIDFTKQWCACFTWLKQQKLQNLFIDDVLSALKQEKHDEQNRLLMIQKSIQINAEKTNQCVNKNDLTPRL